MIKFYLISTLIYIFIFSGGFFLFGDRIIKNGWTCESKNNFKNIFSIIWLSSIPVFRLFFVAFIFISAAYTKEQLEKMKSELNALDDIEDEEC